MLYSSCPSLPSATPIYSVDTECTLDILQTKAAPTSRSILLSAGTSA